MSNKWRIEYDSSNYMCGVILQEYVNNNKQWKPVEYTSHKYSIQERAYPAQEREYLAILDCLRTWRCFVDGNNYEVFTDHLPLKYYSDSSKVSPRLERWMAELSIFSPKIIYKKGIDQIVPDSLSRKEELDCTTNQTSLEPRYLYDSPEACAAIISEKTRQFDDPLITDPIQD